LRDPHSRAIDRNRTVAWKLQITNLLRSDRRNESLAQIARKHTERTMSRSNRRTSMSASDIASSGARSDDPSDGSAGAANQSTLTGMQEQAAEAARAAASDARERAESVYRDASSAAGKTSDAIDDAADALASSGHETLSQAAAALSDRVRSLSSYLEDRKLEDLIGDARTLAQRNPALFIAGGVALGFALSRFLKASASGTSRSVS
jgi:hypothetical protein